VVEADELRARIAELEAELRLLEARFQDVVISTSDWVWEVDVHGRYTYCSGKVEDALGYTVEEMLGKTPFDFMLPEEVARIGEIFQEIIASKRPIQDLENWNFHKDGHEVCLLTNGVPLLDQEGNLVGYRGLDKDITEQKQAAIERDRLQQEALEAQRHALLELSTPIIPVMEGIIIMPLIGSIDTSRAREVTRTLLAGISTYRAEVVIFDITGVPLVDSGIMDHLNKTVKAARLKGAYTIVTGISDAVAETVVDLGIDWSGIQTLRDLQTGLLIALERLGVTLQWRK
jgi:PAS domain S-box-containing protein